VDGEHLNMNNLSIPNVLGRELCEYYCLDLYKKLNNSRHCVHYLDNYIR
jgi:hypothetical protein